MTSSDASAGDPIDRVGAQVVEQVVRVISSSARLGSVVAIDAPPQLDAGLRSHGFDTVRTTADDLLGGSTPARPAVDGEITAHVVFGGVDAAVDLLDVLELLAIECDRVAGAGAEPPLVVVAVPNRITLDELIDRLDGGSSRSSVGDRRHLAAAGATADGLTRAARRAGFETAVVADVAVRDTSPPTAVRAMLGELARRTGHDPEVSHLVRSYRRNADDRPGREDRAPGATPFVSVIVRTQGRRSTLVDTLTSLAAQRDDDLEVLLMAHNVSPEELAHVARLAGSFAPTFGDRLRVTEVTGGGRSAPLNRALEIAVGAYVAILDDDDVVTSDWVAAFRRAAERLPRRVVRARCAVQSIERRGGELIDFEPVSGLDTPYPARFDLLDNIRSNRSPPCCSAIPMWLVDSLELRFDDTLQVCEDWKFQLDAARLVGVSDDPAVTSVYRRWIGDGGSAGAAAEQVWIDDHYRVVADLDAEHTIVPPGSLRRIHELYERLEQLETDLRAGGSGQIRSARSLTPGPSIVHCGRTVTRPPVSRESPVITSNCTAFCRWSNRCCRP
jgi:glycosyltransferase involved in cell wall biosynthesis